ncbi:MAG: VOC family protein [Myxococcota bacterium]|nr:VOC family protein [Deltaproteobacteria bacterium]MDQ3339799.1 VOC family protein [Myxococcota bacterium]
MAIQKITPSLWYTKDAAEAAKFYASIFPDSRVDRVTQLPTDSPSGPAGTVDIVEFTLFHQKFMAMSAGPLDPFNHAISFTLHCESQQEIDKYWAALTADGTPEQCGWLKDKYGVYWQVTTPLLGKLLNDPDRVKAKRAADAMMKMIKIDIGALKRAFEG